MMKSGIRLQKKKGSAIQQQYAMWQGRLQDFFSSPEANVGLDRAIGGMKKVIYRYTLEYQIKCLTEAPQVSDRAI